MAVRPIQQAPAGQEQLPTASQAEEVDELDELVSTTMSPPPEQQPPVQAAQTEQVSVAAATQPQPQPQGARGEEVRISGSQSTPCLLLPI